MILEPGRNCWRVEQAERLALVVDAARYFEVLAAAMERARRSIRIAGWDIHSQVRLRRDGQRGELPEALGQLLEALVRRRRGLTVELLIWDFAMIYVMEREAFPLARLDWNRPRRMRLRLDGNHPLGASHHQKIVVIDDCVAFLGGIDLTEYRWDTPEHAPGDARRVTWRGEAYGPFHDLQVAVQGPAAAALGELFRQRWHRATGRRLARRPAESDPWPGELEPDMTDVPVALARTDPAWDGREDVREVEQLYLDGIAAARAAIYIENQYLTSAVVGRALEHVLAAEQGPQVLIVTPQRCSGWLERASMGVLRRRILDGLRRADRHDRLRVLYPAVAGEPVNVHAKAMVVDDRLLRVGSANLSNRSMGLDTECDLAVEADDGEQVRGLRQRLMAEHLGCAPQELARLEAQEGSLIAVVDRLAGGSERGLYPLEPDVPEWLDEVVPEAAVIDPEQPLSYDDLVASVVPEELRPRGRDPVLTRLALWAGVTLALLLWRFAPPGEALAALLDRGPALAPWLAVVLVAAAHVALAALPRSLLCGATVLLLGPLLGAPLALAGPVVAGLALYGLGRLLPRAWLRRASDAPLDRLGRQLAAARLGQVTKARWLPLAPLWLVDLASGAWGVPLWRFAISLALGELPGALLAVTFAVQLRRVLAGGGWLDGLLLVALFVALAALLFWLRRRLHGPRRAAGQETACG